MKKSPTFLFAFITIILSYTQPLTAQEEVFPRWSFGIKSGINISTKYNAESSQQVGYNIKGLANYHFEDYYFIRSEAGTTIKGASYETSVISARNNGLTTSTNRKIKTQMQYLQLSVSPGVRIPIEQNLSISASIGAYFEYGIDISGRYEMRQEQFIDNSPLFYNELKVKFDNWKYANLSRIDYGLVIAAEIEYCHFILSASYERGLRDIYKPETTRFIQLPYNGWYARSLNFAIGYIF